MSEDATSYEPSSPPMEGELPPASPDIQDRIVAQKGEDEEARLRRKLLDRQKPKDEASEEPTEAAAPPPLVEKKEKKSKKDSKKEHKHKHHRHSPVRGPPEPVAGTASPVTDPSAAAPAPAGGPEEEGELFSIQPASQATAKDRRERRHEPKERDAARRDRRHRDDRRHPEEDLPGSRKRRHGSSEDRRERREERRDRRREKELRRGRDPRDPRDVRDARDPPPREPLPPRDRRDEPRREPRHLDRRRDDERAGGRRVVEESSRRPQDERRDVAAKSSAPSLLDSAVRTPPYFRREPASSPEASPVAASGEGSGAESGELSDPDRPKRQPNDDKANKKSKFESSSDSEDDSEDSRRGEEKTPPPKTTPMETSPPAAAPEDLARELEEDSDEEKLDGAVPTKLLPVYFAGISGCRSVEEFHCLNRIEEGTYGVVYRAKEKRTDEVVALKRLKMEKEKEGFPITSLREINMLLKAGGHENVVAIREIVVGTNMDKIYLCMDYVEHDLKSLMESMKQPFLIGEVKTLLLQLLAGIHHLHDNWILHRDLKTSNLLLSHKGDLKIGDFGLAREYGSPIKPYTPVVVTLWYRAPELLLGTKEYACPIDMWSVGCIFGEFLTLKPMFPGRGDLDELNRIFKMLGTPSEAIWPGYSSLPAIKRMSFAEHKFNNLRKSFDKSLSDKGLSLMNRLLTYNPAKRASAADAMKHEWFSEEPVPTPKSMFPTWPAKSELKAQPSRAATGAPPPKLAASPKAPVPGGGSDEAGANEEALLMRAMAAKAKDGSDSFALRFDQPKF